MKATAGYPVQLGASGFPVISGEDIAAGHVLGLAAESPTTGVRRSSDPVQALRETLRPALMRSPCVIAFSGGRDSSLLLAVLARLAQDEGFDPPIAVTCRYPGDDAADETAWQELVVAHLENQGLRITWERAEIHDEEDFIGPLTAPLLRRHGGPIWPPGVGGTVWLCRLAAGGALVTGNYGDEVLGGHRLPVLRTVLERHGRGLSRADWLTVAGALAPRTARVLRGDAAVDGFTWLREPFRTRVRREAAATKVLPLRWDRSVRAGITSRLMEVGQRTRHQIAVSHDCELIEPLGDPGFIASYAAHGGPFGALGREAGTRLLADGLLPDEVLRRRTKAYFNSSRFGSVSREFIRTWNGRGVDEDLVDVEALRLAWSLPVVPAGTAMLLQQAWLATDGATA